LSVLFLLLLGCSDLIVPAPDTSFNVADFETAWKTVDTVYPYFQFKHINWDSIHTVYRPLAVAAKGDEIFTVLFDMLAELKDGHVSIRTQGGAQVQTYIPPRSEKDRKAYSPLVVRKYFDKELRLAGNQRVEYEALPDGLGYVYVATLSKDEPVLDGFDEALAYLKDTKGLIIDVRHNGGGSDNNSAGIVARLIPSAIDNLPYPLLGGGMQQGGPISPRGPFQYTKPVVMLIDGVCFSSCEDFAEMMKHVSTVTAIGDTTAGGSGAPQLYALPSGRKINVSTKDIRRYDGLPIEWNGVLPDILVPQTEEDIKQGRDLQLERAIQFLQ
jgi:carboxyl-terminal processing protease